MSRKSRDRDSKCLRGGISNGTWVLHSFTVTNSEWNEKSVVFLSHLRRKMANFQIFFFLQDQGSWSFGVVCGIFPHCQTHCCPFFFSCIVLCVHFLLYLGQGLHAGRQAFDVQVLWSRVNALSVKSFCCPSA